MLNTAPSRPLGKGDVFPPLVAEGWVNGPPPSPGAPNMRLLVVDLWADWCPYCRRGAPDLLQVYHKYSDRGVAFVSLTNMLKVAVEGFVREFSVPWANG